MAKTPNLMSLLAGGKGQAAPAIPRLRKPKGMGVPMGGVPDQGPALQKGLGGILAGVPMSVRGRRPRVGGL